MINNILKNLQRQSLRLSLCALALTTATVSFAQDEIDEDAPTFEAPKRKAVADKNQTVVLNGIVTDYVTEQPVAGVRVQALNDSRYTAMTNAKGEFTIKVPTFATALYVEANRYLSQQVSIRENDANQKVAVKLISDKFDAMYENGTDYTAKSSMVSKGGGITIDDEISARLGTDMRTTMRNGNLDQGATMYIRGINSINANSQPLVILDGVELDMQRDRASIHQGDVFNMLSTLSPEDIDKVTVLKNATALYGARGANGVILIDTKRGHSMATRIDAKASAGYIFVPSTPTVMNAAQYRNYATEVLGTISDARLLLENNETFRFLNDNPNAYGYQTYHNDTDWQKPVYHTAFTQNYSVNVQGGDDIGMYNLSVGYVDAKRTVKETSFDRVNVRFNTDINLLWNLKTKFDMSFSRTNTWLFDDGFNQDLAAGPVVAPTALSLIKSPLLNPYQYNANVKGFTSLLSEADDLFTTTGGYSLNGTSLSNPVAIMENAEGERKNKNENTFFNVAIAPTYEISKDLSVTTHFSYYLNRHSEAYYRPNQGVAAFYIKDRGTVYSRVASLFSKENNIISNTHVDWNKKFGAHNVAVMGGFRYNYFSYSNNNLSTDYKIKGDSDKDPRLTVGDNYFSNISGVDETWKQMQWYVNGDYSYKNRYFATVSVLAEANSRFGANAPGSAKIFGTRWAFFPSLQFGWVMTNENWFPKNGPVNYLRLSAGYDISGNDDISNYAAQNIFSSVRFTNVMTGMQLTNIGNDEVKWESTHKWNIGAQLNMFNNRVSLGVNGFIHLTTNMLALKSFENPIGGINNYWVNDGRVQNTGMEFSISGKPIVQKNLTFEVGASLGTYSNKVLDLANGAYTSSVYGDKNIITAEGGSAFRFYGYKTGGVFSTTQEAQESGLYYVDATGSKVYFEAGDVRFQDVNPINAKGEYAPGEIDENDKVVLGDPNPDVYGNVFATLKWKRFTFGMNFNYCIGNDVYNYQRSILNSGSTTYNQQVAEIARWRFEGQVTNIPKATYGDPHGNNRFSDRWIENGSFLRLKTMSVAYEIPVPESWQSWLQGLSVWGEVHNLFTLTQYTGNDPEFSIGNRAIYQGIDAGNVAQGRRLLLGVKINL